MRSQLIVLMLAFLTGCSTAYTQERPDSYYQLNQSARTESGSLFSSDAEVLNDAEIEKILQYRYQAPKLSRIAILPIGWEVWQGWSEEMALATDEINEKLVETLRASEKVYDASFLPSILIPDKKTVPYLREAAARYQADLMLVFRSACQSFTKYRFFRSDQARAYCNVEAILLDVRSGLVPFVSVANQNYQTEEAELDLSFRETVLRSQLTAVAKALEEVSTSTVNFLSK